MADSPWLQGLKIVPVPVVAPAAWGMARNLCPDCERATIAIGAAMVALAIPSAPGQIGAIAAGGLIGWRLLRGAPQPQGQHSLAVRLSRAWSVIALVSIFALLVELPLLAGAVPSHTLALFASFYGSGALVFGVGHVVLPLLQASLVPPGWVTHEAFLARYGAARAVPAPVHLRSLSRHGHGSEARWLDRRPDLYRGDISAGFFVVEPVWTSAIFGPTDFAIGIVAFLLPAFWAVPPWLVVIFGAVAATTVSAIPRLNG